MFCDKKWEMFCNKEREIQRWNSFSLSFCFALHFHFLTLSPFPLHFLIFSPFSRSQAATICATLFLTLSSWIIHKKYFNNFSTGIFMICATPPPTWWQMSRQLYVPFSTSRSPVFEYKYKRQFHFPQIIVSCTAQRTLCNESALVSFLVTLIQDWTFDVCATG